MSMRQRYAAAVASALAVTALTACGTSGGAVHPPAPSGTAATASVVLCHAAYVLKGGQIDVQVAHPDTATRYTLAVTGGTGTYAGVTGQARSVDTGPGTGDRTFYLIRPGQG